MRALLVMGGWIASSDLVVICGTLAICVATGIALLVLARFQHTRRLATKREVVGPLTVETHNLPEPGIAPEPQSVTG